MATDWVKLKGLPCPVGDCGNGLHNWQCADDSDQIWINSDATIECTKGTHSGPIKDWRWNCGAHNGKYLQCNAMEFIHALSMATNLSDKAGAEWYRRLLSNIKMQY